MKFELIAIGQKLHLRFRIHIQIDAKCQLASFLLFLG